MARSFGVVLFLFVLEADSRRVRSRRKWWGGGSAEEPVWEMAWSKEIQLLHGKAATNVITDPNEDFGPVFEIGPKVPQHQSTMLQTLGNRHTDDWTGLVLMGKAYAEVQQGQQSFGSPILLTQWKDEYAAPKEALSSETACENVFAGHTQDDANQPIHINHCNSLAGHGANHGIGAALKDIIKLGHVHLSLRAEAEEGTLQENHWFGVLAFNDHERNQWLANHELCAVKGEHVLILPMDSSEEAAYKAALSPNYGSAYPEYLAHENEDGIVHSELGNMPTHSMTGQLVFRYDCLASNGWRPQVKEMTLLIAD